MRRNYHRRSWKRRRKRIVLKYGKTTRKRRVRIQKKTLTTKTGLTLPSYE